MKRKYYSWNEVMDLRDESDNLEHKGKRVMERLGWRMEDEGENQRED